MCVSTAVLCTLASLSADASPPAIAPPTQEPLQAQAVEAQATITLPAPVENIAAPERLPTEASAIQFAVDQSADRERIDDPISTETEPSDQSLSDTQPDAIAASRDAEEAIPSVSESDAVAIAPLPAPTLESTIQPVPEFSTTASTLTAAPHIAQAGTVPSDNEVEALQEELRSLPPPTEDDSFGEVYEGSPAVTIAIPSGYGADNLEGFANFSYQTRTRYTEDDDATMGLGIGFGDARENIGVQLSYTIASFGENRDFGSGGFNAKLHREFGRGWSAALGWEGFIGVGDDSDFEDSVYGAVTHIARLSPDINDPFSRIAVTAGLGSGRFRTEEAIRDGDDTIGVFGSVALRVARPVSAIVEWTGQDLAMGLSIAPIPNVPWVITPAVRDIAGGGDGARFVIGTGISWQF